MVDFRDFRGTKLSLGHDGTGLPLRAEVFRILTGLNTDQDSDPPFKVNTDPSPDPVYHH